MIVPLLREAGRPVKANLSPDAGLLAAIDEAAAARGLTRSAIGFPAHKPPCHPRARASAPPTSDPAGPITNRRSRYRPSEGAQSEEFYPWLISSPLSISGSVRATGCLTYRRSKYYLLDNVMEADCGVSDHHEGPGDNSKGYPGASRVEARRSGQVFMHPDGSVVLLPKRPASVLRGIVKPRRRPATIEEMSEAAAAGAVADALPRRRR